MSRFFVTPGSRSNRQRLEMITLTLSGSSESIQHATSLVTRFCQDRGFSEDRGKEIATALAEALTNAARHGNRGDPDRPIYLTADAQDESIIVEVQDTGQGPAEIPPLPDLSQKLQGRDRPSGWGLFLMRSLASEIAFVSRPGAGHTVRLRFDRVAPPAPISPRLVKETNVP